MEITISDCIAVLLTALTLSYFGSDTKTLSYQNYPLQSIFDAEAPFSIYSISTMFGPLILKNTHSNDP